jgi:hypothetical protein
VAWAGKLQCASTSKPLLVFVFANVPLVNASHRAMTRFNGWEIHFFFSFIFFLSFLPSFLLPFLSPSLPSFLFSFLAFFLSLSPFLHFFLSCFLSMCVLLLNIGFSALHARPVLYHWVTSSTPQPLQTHFLLGGVPKKPAHMGGRYCTICHWGFWGPLDEVFMSSWRTPSFLWW